MCGDDILDDRESEPGPVGIRRVAVIEDFVALCWRDTCSVVTDHKSTCPVTSECFDPDRYRGLVVLDCVPEEVLEELCQAVMIGVDGHIRPDVECAVLGPDLLPGFVSDTSERHWLGRFDRVASPGHLQQIFDDCPDPVETPANLVSPIYLSSFLDQRQVTLCDGQRIPEIVGDDAGELVESLVLALEFPLAAGAECDLSEHEQASALAVLPVGKRRQTQIKHPLCAVCRFESNLRGVFFHRRREWPGELLTSRHWQ